ncbi:MAG: branched-chain amino acid ABC transporter permease, partial [Rhodospirillaceae bacterium]
DVMLSKTKIFILLVLFAMMAAVPTLTEVFDEPFYLALASRILIFAIAAMSLDLILGYGGMVSFGHAAYIGLGAYAVAILNYYDIDNGWLHLAVAIVGSGFVAAIIGAISIRTGGLYFIMITLAFTQMLFYLGISLEEYGGDDGINTYRSVFGDWIDLDDNTVFYYVILFFLALCTLISWRLVNSRFGMVIRGSHSNERRMLAIGYPVFRYRLVAFIISGAMCGVAGLLLANLTEFVTPDFMRWQRSGEIMIMVLLGGMGTVFGPILGAAVFLLLEDILAGITMHWWIVFGPILLIVILFAKKGLWGLVPGREGTSDD